MMSQLIFLKGVGRWGLRRSEAPPIVYAVLFKNFEYLFSPPPFKNLNSTAYRTSTVAYGVTCYSFRFFIDTIKPAWATNFCDFEAKVNKIAKTAGFLKLRMQSF